MCKLRHCSYSGNTRLSSGDKILSYVFVFNKGVFKKVTSVTSVVLVVHTCVVDGGLRTHYRICVGDQRLEERDVKI
jgi:hypothetical protein